MAARTNIDDSVATGALVLQYVVSVRASDTLCTGVYTRAFDPLY